MNPDRAQKILTEIRELCADARAIRLMEVCGTHTVALFRSGIRSLLPSNLHLISGPGCPVCVTPQGYLDAACEIAALPDTVICTYGDMMRVPGSRGSLADQRALGARIMVIYSARDALKFAEQNPNLQVVFLAVGFETTAPATAVVILEAARKKIKNFRALMGHKLAIPAMEFLLRMEDFSIDGFLCPGHVSVITGVQSYQPLVDQYRKPCAVTGFEPIQMLEGIGELVREVIRNEARVSNLYHIAVTATGNPVARACMQDAFATGPGVWRSLGVIPESGLHLREPYRHFDAAKEFGLDDTADFEPPGCLCGAVIQGKSEPHDCGHFGVSCTPSSPIGPCMVSSEGTCAAWYKYGPPKPRR